LASDSYLGKKPFPVIEIMRAPAYYEIQVEGQLPDHWSDWFDGIVFQYDPESKTTLIREITDQAALIGVLYKIQSLNLTVVLVKRSNSED
jgi:hypothetical protein